MFLHDPSAISICVPNKKHPPPVAIVLIVLIVSIVLIVAIVLIVLIVLIVAIVLIVSHGVGHAG